MAILTSQNQALEAWLNTAIAGINENIDELELELASEIAVLDTALATHQDDVSDEFDAIALTLEELTKMDEILDSMTELNASIGVAESDIQATLNEQGDEGESRDNLIGIILIFLLLTFVLGSVSTFLLVNKNMFSKIKGKGENKQEKQ